MQLGECSSLAPCLPCSFSPFLFSLPLEPCTRSKSGPKIPSSTVWQTTQLVQIPTVLQVGTDGRRYSFPGKVGEPALQNRHRDRTLHRHLLLFFLLDYFWKFSRESSRTLRVINIRQKYLPNKGLCGNTKFPSTSPVSWEGGRRARGKIIYIHPDDFCSQCITWKNCSTHSLAGNDLVMIRLRHGEVDKNCIYIFLTGPSKVKQSDAKQNGKQILKRKYACGIKGFC